MCTCACLACALNYFIALGEAGNEVADDSDVTEP